MPDDGPQIPCPDCAGPQPDTAPEGPWEADDGHCVYGPNHEEIMCFGPPGADQDEDMARRVAAALNGAPATPAERAVTCKGWEPPEPLECARCGVSIYDHPDDDRDTGNQPCPGCGHAPHDNERCISTTDEGRHMCACNFPRYDNYDWTPEVRQP